MINISRSLYLCTTPLQIQQLLQKELNFSVSLHRRYDAEWGKKVEAANGSLEWRGMVQSLKEGDFDIAITCLTMTPER